MCKIEIKKNQIIMLMKGMEGMVVREAEDDDLN